MTAALPAGFTVRLGRDTRRPGPLLVGRSGAVLRLQPRARAMLDADGTLVARDRDSAGVARLLLDRGVADPWWPAGATSSVEDPTAQGSGREVEDVTVVVPVRDRPIQLARLLAALAADLPGLAVVVVDDGSTDPEQVRAVVARHRDAQHGGDELRGRSGCDVRLRRHPASRGPAAARNTGLAVVATPLVAFLDSDVVPVPGWLAVLRRHLDDPSVAVVGPRVLGAEPRPGDSWLCRYEAARSSLDLGSLPAPVTPLGPVAYLPSAALLARCSALADGFDESMPVAEDVDLVWRVRAAGWRVRYEPAALVRHDHRTRLLPWLRRKACYGTGAAPLAVRHGSDVAPLVLTPWTAALTVAVLAQRWWSLPAVAAVGAAAAAGISRRLDGDVRTAAGLAGHGARTTLRQLAAALTRHYWPVVVPAAVVAPRVRRALLVAAMTEAALDHHRVHPDLDPVRFLVARRLDDLAYGAGLWAGALRAGSPRALLPALRGFTRQRRVSP